MKKICFYFILFCALFSCRSAQLVSDNMPAKVNFIELGYGICETETQRVETMPNAPSETHLISNHFKLKKRTNHVRCQSNQQFGIEFLLKSKDYTEVPVETVWTFPHPITNEKGQVFAEIRRIDMAPTNKVRHETFLLARNYFLVKGKWTFQQFYNGKKIFERTFLLE